MKNLKCILPITIMLMLCLPVFPQGAAINTTGITADPSAVLDVSSSTMGTLITRMTTNERNAIANPASGLLIINTTTNCIEVYFSPVWQQVFCGCAAPSSPSEGTHPTTATEITWTWNTVSGATGYKYNTINDYASATDNGTNTSYTQTGLTCNTSYNLYVWAYGVCGTSTVSKLTQTTGICFTCGISSLTFTYSGAQVTYGTVVGQNSTCWLDRNLGATAVATAYNHTAGFGDLFQWGRLDDGHQNRASGITSVQSSSDVPGHSKFIVNSYDWRSPQNNSLWQGVSGINNPCPTGWRVPVEAELNNERLSWSSANYNGAIASPLKIPAAGRRNYQGSVQSSVGYYWYSTLVGGTSTCSLTFDGGGAIIQDGNWRAYGMSIRCIKD